MASIAVLDNSAIWTLKAFAKILVVFAVITHCSNAINLTEAENNLKMPYYCFMCSCKNTSSGILTNCSGQGLFKLPKDIDVRTKELYFSGNFVKTVKYSQLAGLYNLIVLDLSNNTISTIEVGAFRDLSNLTHLFLHGQTNMKDLVLLQNLLNPGVFDGLISLKVLFIHNILERKEAEISFVPTEALQVLTTLEELRIDGVANAEFKENLNNLKNLSTVKMSGLDGTCQIGYLSKKSFVGLEHIKKLIIEKCRIKHLNRGTFWWTPELEYLDLSWNTELEINQFGSVLEELKYTNLKILKVNAIHNPDRAGTELLRGDLKYLRDVKLTEMYIDDNGIEFVDYGVFDMFPETLKRLYLRRNKLNYGLYLYEAVFNNPNLEILDAGDQNVAARSDRVFTSQFQKVYGLFKRDVHLLPSHRHLTYQNIVRSSAMKHFNNGSMIKHLVDKRSESIPVLNLKEISFSGSLSDLRPLNFSATINNITLMDLSRNFMPMLEPYAFHGLSHLKHLNVSSNYMEIVHRTAFYGLSSVHVMDMENNLLGHLLETDKNGNLFSSLVNLKYLNLSRNRINTLDKDIFKHTPDLERVDLSVNYIEVFDIKLSQLSNLEYIDLSYNRINSLPSAVRSHLSDISKHYSVKIDLSNNNLICSCENIPFLKWLFYSDIEFQRIETYYCSLEDNSIKRFNDSREALLNDLEIKCKSYLGIIVGSSTGVSFVLAIVVSYTVYMNRWRLRYLYYMAKVKLDKRHADDGGVEAFTYDVFVSYGDGDRGFVTADMLQNLEVVGGKRLNIRDRDFELGEVIAVNISKAIRTSKKTFLLLSRHFLRNKWCNFEMNMARMEAVHMKRDVIVVIFLETIPHKLLPLEIMDMLRQCPNMDLPKEELRDAFWEKCIEFINRD